MQMCNTDAASVCVNCVSTIGSGVNKLVRKFVLRYNACVLERVYREVQDDQAQESHQEHYTL